MVATRQRFKAMNRNKDQRWSSVGVHSLVLGEDCRLAVKVWESDCGGCAVATTPSSAVVLAGMVGSILMLLDKAPKDTHFMSRGKDFSTLYPLKAAGCRGVSRLVTVPRTTVSAKIQSEGRAANDMRNRIPLRVWTRTRFDPFFWAKPVTASYHHGAQ